MLTGTFATSLGAAGEFFLFEQLLSLILAFCNLITVNLKCNKI